MCITIYTTPIICMAIYTTHKYGYLHSTYHVCGYLRNTYHVYGYLHNALPYVWLFTHLPCVWLFAQHPTMFMAIYTTYYHVHGYLHNTLPCAWLFTQTLSCVWLFTQTLSCVWLFTQHLPCGFFSWFILQVAVSEIIILLKYNNVGLRGCENEYTSSYRPHSKKKMLWYWSVSGKGWRSWQFISYFQNSEINIKISSTDMRLIFLSLNLKSNPL